MSRAAKVFAVALTVAVVVYLGFSACAVRGLDGLTESGTPAAVRTEIQDLERAQAREVRGTE